MTDPQVVLAKREIDQGRSDIQEGLALIEGFNIENDSDQRFAAEILRDVKAKHKALETKRTSITKPMNTALKEVNNLFRPMKEALDKGEQLLKRKIADYQRLQAEKNEQALLEASQAETAEEAEEALAKTEVTASPQGINVRYVWKATVVDETKLPREYLCPDFAQIDRHAREAGDGEPPKPIPGVQFERAPIVSSRNT